MNRQELQHALPRAGQPLRQMAEVADVADAPARGRRTREQRKENSRLARILGVGVHQRGPAVSKRRSIREMPAAKSGCGGNKLTIRNDSRGKSKKYPGWTSTPSCSSRSSV